MAELFISHIDEDQQMALALADALEARGFTAWRYRRDCRGGPDFRDQIPDAIDHCRALIVLLSPGALGSRYVRKEVYWAQQRSKPIVPLLHGLTHAQLDDLGSGLAWELVDTNAIEVPGRDVSAAVSALLEGLRQLEVEPGGPPLPDLRARLRDQRRQKEWGAAYFTAGALMRFRPEDAEALQARRTAEPLIVGRDIIGPDGGAMVWVPPGEFEMGSKTGDAREQPVHRVSIRRGFWLGQAPITNAQYRRYCQETGRAFPGGSDLPDGHPVSHVTWDEAVAYCAHCGLRLPTEAEWEYAAKGPEGRVYPWGDEWDANRCCTKALVGSGGGTCPVTAFPSGASWRGALDMAGNVWEWCADWFDGGYYAVSPPDDPAGPPTGRTRVVRGGSIYFTDPREFRTTRRGGSHEPSRRQGDTGFRCVGQHDP